MNKKSLEPIRPLMLFFVLSTPIIIAGNKWLEKYNVSQDVLLGGSALLFLVSFLSYMITSRSFLSPNPNVFVRAMYTSFIIKFFVVAIAAFIYIQISGKAVNKPALIGCAAFYIIYTGLETRALLKLLKQKRNA